MGSATGSSSICISGALVALFWYRLDPKQLDKPYPWEQDLSEIDDPIIGDEWRDTGGDTALNEQTNPNFQAPPVRDSSQVNDQLVDDSDNHDSNDKPYP